MYLKVGQFKDPTNLESATDSSYMLFTEKSPNFNLFFNSGYEMGLALVGNFGNFDGALGLVQGAPTCLSDSSRTAPSAAANASKGRLLEWHFRRPVPSEANRICEGR